MPNRSYKKELGFFTLVSIVISSQLGSGTFIFPTLLAPFGTMGLFGWVIAVFGAISLALIFSKLASQMPKNGGPHVYTTEAFGEKVGFFTAWTYWFISWASNSLLLVTAAQYLSVITGDLTVTQMIMIEVSILFVVALVNIGGVKFSGSAEAVLTIFKVLPLLVLPLLFFSFFDRSYFKMESVGFSGGMDTIAKTALLTFWGFIGVESATTPAERIVDARRTIPRAIIIGTSCVAFIYLMNVISVIGVTGFDALLGAKAPYALAIGSSLGGTGGNVFIAVLAVLVCIGTLNAWTLTSGQIAEGAASANIFPPIFGKCNKNGAPVASILIASFGCIPFIIFERVYGTDGLSSLVDLLVSIFLFVYVACCLAYIKIFRRKKGKSCLLAWFAIAFCMFVIIPDFLKSIITLAVFIIVGIPVFIYNERLKRKTKAES
jgi:APA family basic amino acid/polyamine antiporter